MNLIIPIIIHTANILGIFSDPFEFEGDYGPDLNPIRQKVFEQVVSKEAQARNLSDREISEKMGKESGQDTEDFKNFLISQAIEEDKAHGPTLGELVSPEIIEEMKKYQESLGFKESDLSGILVFVERYKEQKIFRFLRNNPPQLLSLDKSLKDKAAREGKIFNLPILGSTQLLEGDGGYDLKMNLMIALFTKETLALAKPPADINHALDTLDPDYLKQFLGSSAENKDLKVFSSPLGQLFFYWLYQSLNLDLIATNQEMIAEVNKVKQVFAETLGDSKARATIFKSKLIDSQSDLLFTQESDALVSEALTKEGLFHPIDRQNNQDGTLIFLRSDLWEANYEVISIDNYEGFKKGRMNVILAVRKDSQEPFLLASCHGNSTNSEDGRIQVQLVMEKFHQLNQGNLQLIIGIDANTKTEEDVRLFQEHLEHLGLVSTQTGPTTIKRRMATAQHSKAGRFAIDEEDYLITLKPESGGHFQLKHVTVGFKEEPADLTQPLPNLQNPSDHYPVGATLTPL